MLVTRMCGAVVKTLQSYAARQTALYSAIQYTADSALNVATLRATVPRFTSLLSHCSLSAQRAAAAKKTRTEVKLVTCAQLFEAGS